MTSKQTMNAYSVKLQNGEELLVSALDVLRLTEPKANASGVYPFRGYFFVTGKERGKTAKLVQGRLLKKKDLDPSAVPVLVGTDTRFLVVTISDRSRGTVEETVDGVTKPVVPDRRRRQRFPFDPATPATAKVVRLEVSPGTDPATGKPYIVEWQVRTYDSASGKWIPAQNLVQNGNAIVRPMDLDHWAHAYVH